MVTWVFGLIVNRLAMPDPSKSLWAWEIGQMIMKDTILQDAQKMPDGSSLSKIRKLDRMRSI